MDELRRLRRATAADLCVECGKCTSMCPLGTRADFSARRIATEDLREEVAGRGVGVGRCLTCGACEERCPQGVHFTEFVRGLRAFVPPARRRPCPHGAVLQHAATLSVDERPAARADRARERGPRALDWLDDDLRVSEEGPVGVFVGCAPLFDEVFGASLGVRTIDTARATIRLLNRAGIEPVLVDDERCCGHDQLWGGDHKSYERLARANLESFRSRGVEHLITACAECARTWKLDYPDLEPGYRPRVQHSTEWIAAHLDEFGIRSTSETVETMTYHDPCRLGRHLGVVDAPRTILDALPAIHSVEMDRHGRDSLCCGTSGFQHCDAESRRLQGERLASASRTGASTLLTACPKCLVHFRCAQNEDARRRDQAPALALMDLTVLAAEQLDVPLRGAASGSETSRETTGARS